MRTLVLTGHRVFALLLLGLVGRQYARAFLLHARLLRRTDLGKPLLGLRRVLHLAGRERARRAVKADDRGGAGARRDDVRVLLVLVELGDVGRLWRLLRLLGLLRLLHLGLDRLLVRLRLVGFDLRPARRV